MNNNVIESLEDAFTIFKSIDLACRDKYRTMEVFDVKSRFCILCNREFKHLLNKDEEITDLEDMIYEDTYEMQREYVSFIISKEISKSKSLPFPAYDMALVDISNLLKSYFECYNKIGTTRSLSV